MKNNRIKQEKERLEELSKPYVDDDSKSEMGNTHAQIKHEIKRKRCSKVLYFLETVVPLLESRRIRVEEFNMNSFRITDGIKQIDYFPASGRLFTDDKKWKSILGKHGTVEGFIMKYLGY